MKRTALVLSLGLILLVLLIYEKLALESGDEHARSAARPLADLAAGEMPDWGQDHES